MTYDNTNRGQIWKNDDKQSDTHPDFKGTINVEGVDYWVSAWKRKPDANPKAPALSFSIKLKESQAAQAKAAAGGKQAAHDNPADGFDDTIPF